MSIVTKTGDQGETSLYSGKHVKKSHPRIESVGAIDELSAQLSFVDARKIQADLFELGSGIANPDSDKNMEYELKELESAIAALEELLPPLQNFHLPGGHIDACYFPVARAVCRRAERAMVNIAILPETCTFYINRLSDYLFLRARKANFDNKIEEEIWKKS